jgi:serine/threonine-protein kinase RIM15
MSYKVLFFSCLIFIVDGEGAARYIKSTNGKNTNTPIIAVSAYSGTDPNETSNVFTASLAKPLQKADLIGTYDLNKYLWLSFLMNMHLAVMRQLGFKTSPMQGGAVHPKVTASHVTPIAPS